MRRIESINIIIDNNKYTLINEPEHVLKYLNNIGKINGIKHSELIKTKDNKYVARYYYNNDIKIEYGINTNCIISIYFKESLANKITICDNICNTYNILEFIHKLKMIEGEETYITDYFENLRLWELQNKSNYDYAIIL